MEGVWKGVFIFRALGRGVKGLGVFCVIHGACIARFWRGEGEGGVKSFPMRFSVVV